MTEKIYIRDMEVARGIRPMKNVVEIQAGYYGCKLIHKIYWIENVSLGSQGSKKNIVYSEGCDKPS